MKIKPLGYNVLIRRTAPEEVTDGGIVIVKEQAKREHNAKTRGTIIAVGPRAWTDEGDAGSRCSIGDTVLFTRYSGVTVDEDDYSDILVNDRDIIATLEKGEGND